MVYAIVEESCGVDSTSVVERCVDHPIQAHHAHGRNAVKSSHVLADDIDTLVPRPVPILPSHRARVLPRLVHAYNLPRFEVEAKHLHVNMPFIRVLLPGNEAKPFPSNIPAEECCMDTVDRLAPTAGDDQVLLHLVQVKCSIDVLQMVE